MDDNREVESFEDFVRRTLAELRQEVRQSLSEIKFEHRLMNERLGGISISGNSANNYPREPLIKINNDSGTDPSIEF